MFSLNFLVYKKFQWFNDELRTLRRIKTKFALLNYV